MTARYLPLLTLKTVDISSVRRRAMKPTLSTDQSTLLFGQRLICLAFFLACDTSTPSLRVNIKTDVVPGVEFDRARAELLDSDLSGLNAGIQEVRVCP